MKLTHRDEWNLKVSFFKKSEGKVHDLTSTVSVAQGYFNRALTFVCL